MSRQRRRAEGRCCAFPCDGRSPGEVERRQAYVETSLANFCLGIWGVLRRRRSSLLLSRHRSRVLRTKYDVEEQCHHLRLFVKLLFRPFILKTHRVLAELSLGEVGVQPSHRKVRKWTCWTSA